VEALNARFHSSSPPRFEDLRSAGVVIHFFDETEDTDHGRMWTPCPATLQGTDCTGVNDRVSASIVYSGMARTRRSLPGWAPGSMRLFSQSKGGVVVSSRVVVDSLLCSYATDAGSRERQCPPQSGRMLDRACVPGCLCARHPRWCNPSTADLSGWCDGAAWRPGDLAAMLAVEQSYNYNELVLDAAAWVDALPRTVTAFFAPKTRQCVEAQRNCVDEARKARDAFATEYGFAKEAVPLVWLHLDRTQDPFELVDG